MEGRAVCAKTGNQRTGRMGEQVEKERGGIR